jgi:two-component system, NarL family, response regulator DesR
VGFRYRSREPVCAGEMTSVKRPGADVPVYHADSRSIRVVLAEDMNILRSALVSVLSNEEGIEVAADLMCDHRVMPIAARLRPDVAVLGVDLPQSQHHLATVLELRRTQPKIRLVVLTVATAPGMLRRLLAADVPGLIDKNQPVRRLVQAVRGVAAGAHVLDGNLVGAALSAPRNPLTARERQVLRLLAAGATGAEIAKELAVVPGTVRNYLSNVMTKTRARTRIEAVKIATESGWI